jgi:Ice-binding-like
MRNKQKWKCKYWSLLAISGFATGFLYAPPLVLAATSPTLGAAQSFAVLAGAGISDIPTSAITGDVGNPAGASITGLTCAEMISPSRIKDSDGGFTGPCRDTDAALLTNAQAANTAAFGALSAGSNAPCTIDYGNFVTSLNGLSLGPGVYCTDVTGTTGAFTLSGTLTLTGAGPWIFRSGSTLTTSGTANVVGSDPCNVWWKLPGDQAGSATLGTNTSLIGNILALKGIVLQTGATLTGRALAQSAGAVTLNQNTIGASCFRPEAGIPTLSQWAQIGMVALLLGGGLLAIRRNRHRSAVGC